MMKCTIAFLFLILPALAQQRYASTTGDVVLAGAGTAFTVQQPANSISKTVQLESLTVYCSVACNVTQSQNGTAATSTAGSIVQILPNTISPSATTWTASNAGSGTTVPPLIHLAAGQTIVLDVSKVQFLKGTGTSTNYTATISSITGTTNITFIWSER